MYLKSIEVQGFKSFANKLKFEFREGITGIVGPNGSGKSNVADAVRWVLGEQSAKQLRSGSMQDVIFAGTESRKPQGFASVAITFDNSDHMLDTEYGEVTVTRRLYRSGESEYLINNAHARLRDIQEIFYDTGIGQEGYSIIGQGQIERILSGKADERRELFDEAAGIVKFKKRKAAALKKLDQEHQNMMRVSDVLKELTSRLGPLKKQSETAKTYLDRKQALRDLDINLFMIEEDRTELQLADLTGKLSIAEDDMAETRVRFDQTRQEYDEVEQKLSHLDEEIADQTEKNSRVSLVRQQLSGQIDLLNEQLRAIDAARDQLLERREAAEADLKTRAAALEDERAASAEAEEEAERTEASEKKEAAALEGIDSQIADVTGRIEKARNDVIGMLQSRVAVKGEIQRYDAMLEQLGIRRSEIMGRLLRIREDESAAKEEYELRRREEESVRKSIEELKKKSAECSQDIVSLQRRMSETNGELDAATASWHRDTSRLESLKGMAERYEGYGGSIRRIMELKKRNPGIKGVVADLIEVPEEYETAVETALGGSIRNIVTDNEATAKYLIEYLKSNKFGRATFLPLTSIRGRSPDRRDVLKEEGVIGIASALVSADEDYRELVEYLLGRIVVVSTIDQAIRIGRKYRHSIYMVTLAGESFAPGGSITGGAFRNSDNLLGRRREIEELETGTVQLKKRCEALRQEIAELKDKRNALREELAGMGTEEQNLALRLNTAGMAARQAEEQMQLSGIDRAALEKENAEIERQMQEIRDKNSGAGAVLQDSENAESKVNSQAEKLREEEENLRNMREQQEQILQKVRIESAAAREKQLYRAANIKRLSEEVRHLEEEKADLISRMAEGEESSHTKHHNIEEIRKTDEAAAAEYDEGIRRLEALRNEKQSLSESHRDFFSRRDELSERMARLDREIFRLNAQQEKLQENREELTNYMFEEYNLTPSEIRKSVIPEYRTDRQAVKKEINSIRENIRDLGPVNVDAIEEYKEISERHEFLDGQYQDLVKSEETLQDVIRELDAGMRKQFSEKIEEIRSEFDKAFKELFGGGKGVIDIDPDADILEAGITIIAHPPGKKLQNMLQLSGGEKALTAIALLFAIQNLKPSPFCLLDEIEAALDESNVERYAQYLHKLTAHTQFIIITHRRGTMTAADRLYGITMQEKGVSAMVSVNLIEDALSK